jgi:predicted nucleic acid-binding protein
MIAVDASTLVDALVDDGRAGRAARAALASDTHWAAPAHLLVEVVSVIRGKALNGKIASGRADDAIAALPALVIDQVEIAGLVDRMWQLRDNVSAYDAAYVAVAEMLACPLVTVDGRPARACEPRCDVRLVTGS